MSEKLVLKDDSGDRNYFTIIPNYILNHSTANDQALYLQMKRLAGEKGRCLAGYRYFTKHLGIGNVAIKESIKYLTEHKWITYIGKTKVKTASGEQLTNTYKVNNVWKRNAEYYQGVSETDHHKGVSETDHLPTQGVSENSNGVSNWKRKKNIRKNKDSVSVETRTLNKNVQLFIRYYLDEYKVKIHNKIQPDIDNKKDIALIKSKIKKYGLLELKRLLDIYFESDDKFYKQKVYGLSLFLSQTVINELRIKSVK